MSIFFDFSEAVGSIADPVYCHDTDEVWSAFEAQISPLGMCSIHYESGVPRDGTAEPCLKSETAFGPVFGDLVCRDFMEAIRCDPDFHAADGFVRHCESSVVPLIYDAASCEGLPMPMQRVNDLARDFHVTGGLIVPLRGNGGATFGNVSYMFDRHTAFDVAGIPVAELTALAHLVHGVLTEAPTQSFEERRFARRRRRLTRQETTCLSWVASGMSTKRLAHRMGISDATANEYIRNACRKLHAATRAEAAAKAVASGIISL